MTSDPNPPGRVGPQPRYPRFLATGAAAGLLVALLVAVLGPSSARYSRASVFVYVALLAVLTGALLGGLLAVVLERGDRAGEARRHRSPRRR